MDTGITDESAENGKLKQTNIDLPSSEHTTYHAQQKNMKKSRVFFK